MTSLDRHGPSGVWRIGFRLGRHQFYRFLETTDGEEAREDKSRIERTLRLIKSGDKELPPGATPEQVWTFLRLGGRVTGAHEIGSGVSLEPAVPETTQAAAAPLFDREHRLV